MRKLYFHIGLPKTGTTFLQSVFALNSELYKKNGLIYPDLNNSLDIARSKNITSGNGVALAMALNLDPSNLNHKFDYKKFFSNLDGNYDYLISSEWLINIRISDINYINDLLSGSHEIIFLASIRSFSELVLSNYLQGLKIGVYIELDEKTTLKIVEGVKYWIRNLFLIHNAFNLKIINYNIHKNLALAYDNIIFGRELSKYSDEIIINKSPDAIQVEILKLISTLNCSNFLLNNLYIEKNSNKNNKFSLNSEQSALIEEKFSEEISAINDITDIKNKYLSKKSKLDSNSFNYLRAIDIDHITTSIKTKNAGTLNLDKASYINIMHSFVSNKKLLPNDFDPILYLLMNQDLISTKSDPTIHYINYGIRENRAYKII